MVLRNVKSSKSELDVERKRIDAIVALKAGSTTGDAELQDIRIGVDSVKHTSAGDAVRSQVIELMETVDKQIYNTYGDIDLLRTKIISNSYAISTTGVIASYTGWNRTDYIEVDIPHKYIWVYVNGVNNVAGSCVWYDANKKYISFNSIAVTTEASTTQQIYIPETARFFILSWDHSAKNSNLNIRVGYNTESVYTKEEYLYKSDERNINAIATSVMGRKRFYDISSNIISDNYINADTGAFTSYARWVNSGYIDLDPGIDWLEAFVKADCGQKYNAFYDKDKKFISSFTLYSKSDKLFWIKVPSNAKYFAISAYVTQFDKIYMYNYFNVYVHNKDDFMNLVKQSKRGYNDGYKVNVHGTLQIGIITDVHGYSYNFERFTAICKELGIDNMLSLGDMVHLSAEDDYSYVSNTTDGEKVLMVLGNHDSWNTWSEKKVMTATECYTKYFKPLISNWGLTNTAENRLYYYKDFTINDSKSGTDGKVRLFILDCMHWDTTQLNWLQSGLNDALTNSIHVIIGSHYQFTQSQTAIDIGFNSLDYGFDKLNYVGGTSYTGITTMVDTFKKNGGNFIAYISGHAHFDKLGEFSGTNGKQLCITFENGGCESEWGDSYRKYSLQNEDSFNIISIDVYSKLIKVVRYGNIIDRNLRSKKYFVYNYGTNKLISHG